MNMATSQNLTTSINVNGRQYTARRLKPSQAIQLATRFAKIIGPGIGKAMPTDEEKKAGKKFNVAALMEGMSSSLDEAKVDSFIKDMMSVVAYQNEFLSGNKFEDHFQGHLEDLFPIVGELIQFQFGNFLKGLLEGKVGQAVDSAQ